jgi:hypothetical protein
MLNTCTADIIVVVIMRSLIESTLFDLDLGKGTEYG